mmetsp:Transcript_39621/g.69666  ORF Transcript_39621/g.69666 Transcript_39621/m.69666 type:complete len:233 (-) Transcript_39621:236-934(-)
MPSVTTLCAHQVHQDGIEDTLQQELQGNTGSLFLSGHCRVFRLLDPLQQAVDWFLPLAIYIHWRVKEEAKPFLEPRFQSAQLLGVAVDHRWAEDRFARGQLNRVGHAVWHACKPLLTDCRVTQEFRDNLPRAVVCLPHLLHNCKLWQTNFLHVCQQPSKHCICEDEIHTNILVCRLHDETLNFLHELLVPWIWMRDPILKRIVIHSCHIPAGHLQDLPSSAEISSRADERSR